MSTTDDPLTELLGVDSSEFLAADWERHPRHIGSATTSFRAALSLDDMDEVVVRAESDDAAASQTVVLLFKALEQAHGYASAHAAFADGASIVINHVDKAWPPAQRPVRAAGRAVPLLRLRQPVLHAARVADGAAALGRPRRLRAADARRQALARVAVRPLRRAAAAVCRRAGGQGAAAQAARRRAWRTRSRVHAAARRRAVHPARRDPRGGDGGGRGRGARST